jgi:hypothetical protein
MRGTGALAAIALTLVISKHLSTIEARNWFIAINIITILGTCLRWGMDEIIVKRLAQSKSSQEDNTELLGVLYFLKIRLQYAILILVFFFVIAAYPLMSKVGLEIADLTLIVFTSIFVALLMATGRVLQGLGQLNKSAFFLTMGTPLVTSLSVLIFTKLEMVSRWQEVVTIYIVVTIAFFLIASNSLPISYKLLLNFVRSDRKTSSIKSVHDLTSHKSANLLGIVVLATQGLPWTGLSIVPIYFNPATANTFIVAQKLTLSISLIALMTNFAISTKLAKQFQIGNAKEIWSSFIKGLAFILIGCLAISIIAVLYTLEIVRYANIEGVNSRWVFLNLVVSQIFFGIGTYCALFLTMAGKESRLLATTVIINSVGSFLLILSCMSKSVITVAFVYNISYIVYAMILFGFIYSLLRNHEYENV